MKSKKRLLARYIVSGAAAGAVCGLFGAGGGLLLVPLLTGWVKIPGKQALASSVCIIWPICLASACIYYAKGILDLPGSIPYLAGGAIGGFISARLFDKAPARWLRGAFALLMLYGGARATLGV